MSVIGLVREVSPAIAHCELTHLIRESIDVDRARTEHAEYVATLESFGLRIVQLPEAPDFPDAVFVEDTAVVLDQLAVLTRPGAESRRAEVGSVEQALAPFRPLHRIQPPGTLDGGDVLLTGRTLHVGITPRTNRDGIVQLATIVGAEGYEVRAVQVQGCLHLKSAVTALDPETLLINPEWAHRESFPGFRFVEVDPAEPAAGNALALPGGVIHPSEFPRTGDRIRRAGFEVRPVPAGELAKAEGGVTCCSVIFRTEGA